MGNYGLTQCPIFREKGDFTETSAYGQRLHPVTGTPQFHSGVDGTRGGHIATIVAIEDGEVIDVQTSIKGADTKNAKGNYVRLKHKSGRHSWYLHLTYGSIPNNIVNGSMVAKGQILGTMGNTGLSDGSHIHFQVYDTDGTTIIDPKPFLMGKNINNKEETDMFVKVTECKRGDKGEVVYRLQQKLCQLSADLEKEVLGHSTDKYGNLDKTFGKGLENTLKRLQEQAGLTVTGTCDKATCDMLNSNCVELYGRIATAKSVLDT